MMQRQDELGGLKKTLQQLQVRLDDTQIQGPYPTGTMFFIICSELEYGSNSASLTMFLWNREEKRNGWGIIVSMIVCMKIGTKG